jgi:hypothetical protein
MKVDQPQFPVTFTWTSSGETEVFESLEEIECNVEHFDSSGGAAKVTDAIGRPVRIRVSLLDAEIFELQGDAKLKP